MLLSTLHQRCVFNSLTSVSVEMLIVSISDMKTSAVLSKVCTPQENLHLSTFDFLFCLFVVVVVFCWFFVGWFFALFFF